MGGQARSLASNLMGGCGWWMQLSHPIFDLPSDLGAGGFGIGLAYPGGVTRN
jgi:hypothetical protein